MRGRFAPSPTGQLHLGNARTALLAWLQARAAGGTFLLRIEDLDAARCRPEHVDELFRDLEYLGLDWDEPPVFQSRRREAYREALAHLQAQGRLYPCFCSRAEVARAASAPHGPSDDGPRYSGTCAALSLDAAEGQSRTRPPALRFRVLAGEMRFQDLVCGACVQDVAAEVGDFAVRRSDGVPSYQLAVVVDDAASKITHVLRGDDLLASTARQLQLYQALGLLPPRFAHVPLLLGADRKRLAKQEGALALSFLRQRGVPPERVVGLLAQSSGLCGEGDVRAGELVRSFSLDRVGRAGKVATEPNVRRRLGLD